MLRQWLLGSLLYVIISADASFQGTLVPLTIGADGVIGQIQIGTPGQTMDVQLDSAFSGVMVEAEADPASGRIPYSNETSTTFSGIINSVYTQRFADGAEATSLPANETFNIGGRLFGGVPFGQLFQYNARSGNSMPFSGASGIIGLNYKSTQDSGQPSFMYAIKDQLSEWVCTLDSYRAGRNGTWTFGMIPEFQYAGDIAWADRNTHDDSTWGIDITVVSAGDKKYPPIRTWSAAVSTEDMSMIWPQKLLDWYFAEIETTWSPLEQTYRYPCNIELPDFTFELGNGTFTIPGSYMPYERDESGTTCIPIMTGDNSTDSGHEYTFGAWWSQLGLLILDYENSRVGFANKTAPLPTFDPASLRVTSFD